MSADTCPTCGQPVPDGAPKPKPRRVQATYRTWSYHHPDDLPTVLAEYRERYGSHPAAILLGDVPDGLTDVSGVPVIHAPAVAKPVGMAYLEVGP